jgi:2-amino-4-hydroxy-6-hydroxymethyldihydropteridine diphosphokinase
LDLDLLALGTRVITSPELRLPHPRMMERAFVLAPLCEIAPGWRHPLSEERACEALAALDTSMLERTRIEWE